MHRVEYPSTKPVRREVTVHCTDSSGTSERKRVPLVSLATFILNSVQPPSANRSSPQVQRIDWSNSNV
jgi:hypothetical protein